MIKIERNADLAKLIKLYAQSDLQINFVASVLTHMQNGEVFSDSFENPKVAIVIHDFGWAQIFGDIASGSEWLQKKIFQEHQFNADKLRFSCLKPSDFTDYAPKSERCKFEFKNFDCLSPDNSTLNNIQILPLDRINSKIVNEQFGMDFYSRNWPSYDSFDKNAFGFVAFKDATPVGVCYSCANYNDKSEVDIFIAEDFRKIGLAYLLCSCFIKHCLANSIKPEWDCYTNNIGSMALARKLGFESVVTYDHYVFPRMPME